MITARDFIHLPFTPDLTKGGIACACRPLNCTSGRMDEPHLFGDLFEKVRTRGSPR
jgi:hypothetical protein